MKLTSGKVFLKNEDELLLGYPQSAKSGTMAYKIMTAHNHSGNDKNLQLIFDSLTSHDITYVGVTQTAKAIGLTAFPVPYVLTNCHNSLCAVGGTINKDDHQFGLSAAKKYGGDYVPAHLAVIHQYMREAMAGCGKMILGTDSHTRYGPLGTMGIGEGGGEIVKQLIGRTYDINYPDVIAVKLTGAPQNGVGSQDVALALIKAVFANGFAQNKVLEFIGSGIANLSMDYRLGIDVMTTEAACLSSIWTTDDKTHEYLHKHGRAHEYYALKPDEIAEYDGLIEIDLGQIKPMIALPFHPSNAFTIDEFNANMRDIIHHTEQEGRQMLGNDAFSLQQNMVDGKLKVSQAIVAGCAGGTYENIVACRDILQGVPLDNHALSFSVYPASQPIFYDLNHKGVMNDLMLSGAIIRTAFCGPCFGAGDVPANNSLSIRHVTRNFPNREGAKPSDGQIASVAIMDARSIAATVRNGGVLTSATSLEYNATAPEYTYNPALYKTSVYRGYNNPQPDTALQLGPNIKEWPDFDALKDNLLLRVCSVIRDEVTTTDELIPSGEASSYRSNPLKLAEFTLSRKDPGYLPRAKAVMAAAKTPVNINGVAIDPSITTIGSVIISNKPGDGSAREQAASCQRVLGGAANIAAEYATKRYRSNLINWGIVPFTVNPSDLSVIGMDDYIYIRGIRAAIANGVSVIPADLLHSDGTRTITLQLDGLLPTEQDVLLAGCLINYYRESSQP